MSEHKIRFDREDVTLEPIPIEDCSECVERPATHYLQVELRGIGWTTSIGERSGYCLECGAETLADLRATMPERLNEDGTDEEGIEL